jgi:hypothetical protein
MSNVVIPPSELTQDSPLSEVKHAWYSPTQESVLKLSRVPGHGEDKTKPRGVPIYRGAAGQPIRVTMISDTIEHGTTFKDMEYMGEVSMFMGLGEFREDIL